MNWEIDNNIYNNMYIIHTKELWKFSNKNKFICKEIKIKLN